MKYLKLPRRLLYVFREHYSALKRELDDEFREFKPHLENIKNVFYRQFSQMKTQIAREIKDYIEGELKLNWRRWQILLLRDPELEEAYSTLGLPYATELEIVKKHWLELLKETHPDRYSYGDDWSKKLATERTQKLTAAYHKILTAHRKGLYF